MNKFSAKKFTFGITAILLCFSFIALYIAFIISGSSSYESMGISKTTFAVRMLSKSSKTVTEVQSSLPIMIIDAGHGGMDGGAVSDSGMLEKNINLEIAKKVKSIAMSLGISCIMTREDDNMLYVEGEPGSKKMQDLKNRVKIANSYENALFVSIHQNKFPQKKYSGLQVYYSKNHMASKEIATLVQSNARLFLQNENNREIKRADSSIFVLDNTNIPAILVECGFLSNDTEVKNLTDSNYQCKLAAIIVSSVFNFANTSRDAQ